MGHISTQGIQSYRYMEENTVIMAVALYYEGVYNRNHVLTQSIQMI